MIMSTFELKFFTLAWNEAEAFIKILKNCETLSPRFMPKSLEIINFENSALFGLEKDIV